MSLSWDEASSRYANVTAEDADEKLNDCSHPEQERAVLEDYFLRQDATDFSEAVAAAVVGLESDPSIEALAGATGADPAAVREERQLLIDSQPHVPSPSACGLLSEFESADDSEEIRELIRYYFPGVVERELVRDACEVTRTTSEPSTLADGVEALSNERGDLDHQTLDRVVQLAEKTGVAERAPHVEAKEVRETILSTFEECLSTYASETFDGEPDDNELARFKIEFPRVSEMERGNELLAAATGVSPRRMEEVDVATNPGGVEIDPIRRRVLEEDEGRCVRCGSEASVVHRVAPDEQPTAPDTHASLCSTCHGEAFDGGYDRRYEAPREFWEWSRASNTSFE